MTRSSPRRRVAAVGLDALEWSWARPFVDRGELPTLAGLLQRSRLHLLHDPDYRTGLVWEHFVHGQGCEQVGRHSVVQLDPSTYDVRQLGAAPAAPFWAGADPATAVVFDVPYVHPASLGPGVAVTDWGAHDPGYPRASVPRGLLTEIDEALGPHPASSNCYGAVWHAVDRLEDLTAGLEAGARTRPAVVQRLLERCPDWDLLVAVFSEPHTAGEQMWHGVDPGHPLAAAPSSPTAAQGMRRVLQAVDEGLGRLLAQLPDDTTTIVFSMHGMGPNDADVASMALLPELLLRRDTGRTLLRQSDAARWRRMGMPMLVPAAGQSWTNAVAELLGPPPLGGALRHLGARVRARARRPAPPHPRAGVMGVPIAEEDPRDPHQVGQPETPLGWQLPCRYSQWWPEMEAFAVPTFYDGRVRVNLEGRERHGIVARHRYREVLGELERFLGACRSPRTGRAAVADLIRLRADDPMDPDGPEADLQVVWAGDADAIDHPDVGLVGPVPYRRTGGHSPRGFALVGGPGIEAGEGRDGQAVDVSATVADLLGRPTPRPLGGTSLLG